VSLFTSIQIQIGFSVLWQTTYKMGTYQQSLLTHFPATEDVRTTTGRRQWSLMPLPLSLTLQVSMSMSQPQTRACPPRAQSSSRKTRRRVQMSTGHLPCRTRPRKKDEEEPLTLSVHRQHQPLPGRSTAILLKVWVRVWRPKGTQSRGPWLTLSDAPVSTPDPPSLRLAVPTPAHSVYYMSPNFPHYRRNVYS